ncbi:hypothetical protein Y032_0387g462 [Ancylostoma ceylanicum]|uniref:Uncharacterized protein n=1 Tax=Ancylostoma ceylanicum TaxID=53326 RepID=A0A016RT45_9BILA|nr:hypothetical protein Y032_0387g462 [Ancylostoma ceylanicum]
MQKVNKTDCFKTSISELHQILLIQLFNECSSMPLFVSFRHLMYSSDLKGNDVELSRADTLPLMLTIHCYLIRCLQIGAIEVYLEADGGQVL